MTTLRDSIVAMSPSSRPASSATDSLGPGCSSSPTRCTANAAMPTSRLAKPRLQMTLSRPWRRVRLTAAEASKPSDDVVQRVHQHDAERQGQLREGDAHAALPAAELEAEPRRHDVEGDQQRPGQRPVDPERRLTGRQGEQAAAEDEPHRQQQGGRPPALRAHAAARCGLRTIRGSSTRAARPAAATAVRGSTTSEQGPDRQQHQPLHGHERGDGEPERPAARAWRRRRHVGRVRDQLTRPAQPGQQPERGHDLAPVRQGSEQQRHAGQGHQGGEQFRAALGVAAEHEERAEQETCRHGRGQHPRGARAATHLVRHGHRQALGRHHDHGAEQAEPEHPQQHGSPGHDPDALGDVGGEAPPFVPGRRALADQGREREGRDHEGGSVQGQRRAHPGRRDEQAPDEEARHLPGLRDEPDHGAAGDVLVPVEQLRQQGALRGVEGRRQQADEHQHPEDHDQRQVGDDEERDEPGPEQVADDHEATPPVPVGQRRQDRSTDEPGEVGAGVRGGRRERRPGAVVDEQRHRDAGDLVAQEAEPGREQHTAELRQREHRADGDSCRDGGGHLRSVTDRRPEVQPVLLDIGSRRRPCGPTGRDEALKPPGLRVRVPPGARGPRTGDLRPDRAH